MCFLFQAFLGEEEKTQPPAVVRQKLRNVLMLVAIKKITRFNLSSGPVHDQTSAWEREERGSLAESNGSAIKPGGWLSLL